MLDVCTLVNQIEEVQVNRMFLRATTEDDWELHLSLVRSMLPLFIVTDKISMRSGLEIFTHNIRKYP